MARQETKKVKSRRLHVRVRKKISGDGERPRLAVHTSCKHVYCQIIDDISSTTLAAASSNEPDLRGEHKHGANCEVSRLVGQLIAKRAAAKGITEVVFDRGGKLYHGRVKSLAEAAREGGLQF